MSKIDIYTKGHCPYCHRAKALLTQKKVSFNEIKIDVMPELRSTMIERASGKSTVPQIFIKNLIKFLIQNFFFATNQIQASTRKLQQ